jgi:hypothetical protein
MGLLKTAFQLTYEISPVILTGGIAQNIPGGMLPIVSITEAANFITGLLSGGDAFDLDDFFAHFVPLTGADLIKQRIGEYSFANQATAANAVITDPLLVSLKMICPARGSGGGYLSKLATMTALQAALAQHNVSGGTYIIATPSYFYTNCVMLGMKDISSSSTAQPQTEWQFDFKQPLLTLQAANQAQNNQMGKLSSGTQVSADGTGGIGWSSFAPTVNTPPSIVAGSVVGSGQNLGATITAAPLSSSDEAISA